MLSLQSCTPGAVIVDGDTPMSMDMPMKRKRDEEVPSSPPLWWTPHPLSPIG